MQKSIALVQPSQVGRAHSQGAPLFSWLPSGLTMAIVALLSVFLTVAALALADA